MSRSERIEGLRGKRIEYRVYRVRPGGLQTGVRLKPEPGRISRVDVVVDTDRLHLFMVVAGM